METFTIQIFHGQQIEPHINQLARLRIEVFREFPYLYDGNLDYEKKYLKTYTRSKNSIAVLVFDGTEIVGASTGLPLSDETDEFKKPFSANGYNPGTVFYCGESILKKEYRGRGIYSTFMRARENHAHSFGRFDLICFCAVSRPENHPLRPADYKPLDAIWKKFGYRKMPQLKTTYTWKDVDMGSESKKEMIFWVKEL